MHVLRRSARAAALVVVAVVTVGAVRVVGAGGTVPIGAPLPAAGAATLDTRLVAFAGLGTWVDVYDYVPGLLPDGAPAPLDVSSVETMAALGIRTLYLQAAQDDDRIPGDTVDPALVGPFLRRAHQLGMRVVAWYLPKLSDVEADLRRVRALDRFRFAGHRFDALALDIEWTAGVADVEARNDALVSLSRQVRKAVGTKRALGAIVLEPLLLEQVNPRYWPDFPWRRVADSYDVWLPMSYWTNRNTSSGLRDGYRYTSENISRLRELLDDRDALVHAIGGVADSARPADYVGFMRAVRTGTAMGWSVYDFNTTTSGVWATLREVEP